MLGINGGEFVLLLVVALVVVGPERLPRYAEQLGAWVRTLRRYAATAKERVSEEIGEDVGDVDWAALDPRRYDPRRIVREALLDDDPPAPRATGATAVGATGAAGVSTTKAARGARTGAASGAGGTRAAAPGTGASATAGGVAPARPAPAAASPAAHATGTVGGSVGGAAAGTPAGTAADTPAGAPFDDEAT